MAYSALITAFIILIAAIVIFKVRDYRFLKINGWITLGYGRDEMVYIELEGSKKRSFRFYAEMQVGPVKRQIYLPSELEWDSQLPSWAHGRRDEIIDRIKVRNPEPRNSYSENSRSDA
jgi:hypothetical protein